MRVLVAGASGFLGLSAVKAMAAAGHEVRGLVRSPEKAAFVEAAGGAPVTGDILSIPALVEAAAGCDALVHLAATVDPASRDLGQSLSAKVRVDGAYNLVAAARKVGARRLVVGSGTWLHGDRAEPISEAAPVRPTGTSMFNWQAERAAMDANKPGALEVVVVRPAMVYGNGGWFKEMVLDIRDGRYRVPGDGANHWSPLHLADCGGAFVTALEKGKAGEVYLVADDEPVTLRALTNFVAEELGVARPSAQSMEEAARRWGEPTARHLAANQAVSNAKVKTLGWRPRYPRYRQGMPEAVREVTRA